MIINIFISSKIEKMSDENFQTATERLVQLQAENISSDFEFALNQVKEITSNPETAAFVKLSNETPPPQKQVEAMDKELNKLKHLNLSIECSYIINNLGVVVASTDETKHGTAVQDYDKLVEYADLTNGISALRVVKIAEKNIPAYCITKSIYSDDNVKQGTYLQICNTLSIQKDINVKKAYDSEFIALVDQYGNVFDYPYANIVSYEKVNAYEPLRTIYSDAVSQSNEISKSKFSNYTYARKNMIAYNAKIPSANWAIVMSVYENDINAAAHSQLISIRLLSLCLFAGLMILAWIFANLFSKPITNIVEVLTRKQRGDQSARFSISSDDDFGMIGRAFNSMFDDVFESEQRYRTIVEMTDNIVFEINFKKNRVYISNNFNQKFSFRAKSDSLQDSFFYKGRIHKDDKDRYTRDFERLLASANYLQGEYRFKNLYGDFAWILIRATKFFDRDDSPTKVIGVIVDIDKKKKSEMHLLQRASYDALTQLYNRETFIKTLANEFELSAMRKTLDAILFLDLDDFKHFNDQYGHACGDEVLKFTADCLKEICFDKGFAGRFGGDEFVVCLNNQKYFGDPGIIAQEIIDALGKGFVSETVDEKLTINCSIGIAFFSENGKNCEEVLNSADEAMYTIKKHGKSNYGYVGN
ncbi:MAG: diguanylate cyclase, partial [Oscillospiraceae bacterium]